MPTADEILRRMADDPAFAELVYRDSVAALEGIDLSASERERLERVVREVHQRPILDLDESRGRTHPMVT